MRLRLLIMFLLAIALVAALPAAGADATPGPTVDDVVVVAVVDGSFSPYHFDFVGHQMPQHLDDDTGNDLPLDQAPHTWISGFPDPSTFASYESLDITIPDDSGQATASLSTGDNALWAAEKTSTRAATNYSWIPGTKIVGALRYGSSVRAAAPMNNAHGARSAASAVGNIHGTCPECVVVLITYGGNDREAANDWAMDQPWIDVVTHSYGYSTAVYDKIYNGSDLAKQRTAVERGQSLFWSASNGQANAFDAPTLTYFASAKGPDWLVTVGATSPQGGNYTGSGKTVDVASIGNAYPSTGGTTVTGTGTHSGTSNATPTTAGLYAQALAWARDRLDGPSRAQSSGVVATGAPVACGSARTACELGDGVLTREELETRLFQAALRTPQGPEFSLSGVAAPVTTDEYELASEGHGTFFARLSSDATWQTELGRITRPMDGTAATTARYAGEREWMRTDSYCRQEIWGSWTGGEYVAGATPLPAASPLWPLRTALVASCDQLRPIPVAP